MSYATFEDEEAQLPAAPKRTCWIRRIFSVALVVGLVCAAASGTRQATPLQQFPWGGWTPLPEPYVCYFQDRWCYSECSQDRAGEAECLAAHGEFVTLTSIYTGGLEHGAQCD